MPWGWHAFSSPALFAAFILCLVSLVPAVEQSGDRFSDVVAAESGAERGSRSRRLSNAIELGHLLVASGLLATIFLGGWAEPFAEAASWARPALGILAFQIKTVGLLLMILLVRWALCHVGVEQAKGVLVRYLLPLTPCVLGGTLLWTLGAKLPLVASARGALSAGLLFMCLFAVLYLIERVTRELRRPGTQASVNPWL